ncbi:hypothetical protein HDU81_009535 [Chytriomyces hyalinus]|nr:hypothetical protein HDU81_009535 [Chytriomyces hyalinus]
MNNDTTATLSETQHCQLISLLTDEAVQLVLDNLSHSFTPSDERKFRLFAQHIILFANPDAAVMLSTTAYLDRYFKSPKSLNIMADIAPYAILLTIFSIACKYNTDTPLTNKLFQEMGQDCFTNQQINTLERKVLQILEYKLSVGHVDFEVELAERVERLSLGQGFDGKRDSACDLSCDELVPLAKAKSCSVVSRWSFPFKSLFLSKSSTTVLMTNQLFK